MALACGGDQGKPGEPPEAGVHIVANSMFGLPEELRPTNNSGVSLVRNTPEVCSLPYPLELQPSGQLNLALTEEGAVGTGDTVESRGATAEIQEWSRRGGGAASVN